MFSSGPASQVVLFDQLDLHHHPTQKKKNQQTNKQEETLRGNSVRLTIWYELPHFKIPTLCL